MKRLLLLCCAACALLMASAAYAAGPHDMECMECHSTHYAKGDYAVGVQPLSIDNPARTRTAQKIVDIDALCLGCHNDDQGILPVNLHTTHPTGVTPTYTKVPRQLLKNGVFSCVSCHNPHPSNANYKYLIVPTEKGGNMGTFCAMCHPNQSDPESVAAAKAMTFVVDGPGAPIVAVPAAAAAAKQ